MRCYGMDSSGQVPGAGSCEKNNELSGSIKYWYFLDWLRNYQLLGGGLYPISYLAGPYILGYL